MEFGLELEKNEHSMIENNFENNKVVWRKIKNGFEIISKSMIKFLEMKTYINKPKSILRDFLHLISSWKKSTILKTGFNQINTKAIFFAPNYLWKKPQCQKLNRMKSGAKKNLGRRASRLEDCWRLKPTVSEGSWKE